MSGESGDVRPTVRKKGRPSERPVLVITGETTI